MNNVIISGDLHIQKKPGMWAGRAEISGDDLYALEQIEHIRQEYCADLFLLGDVFDTVTNLPRPIVAVQSVLGEAAKAGRVFYLQGQHELVVQAHYENNPWMSLVPGAKHIAGSFDFLGHKAYGLDYFPQAFEALNFAKVPLDTEVLFVHGTIDVAMPMAFHFTSESLNKLPKLKIVFGSDWHQAESYQASKVFVHYTGSTWQVSANEPRKKSVMLVSLDDDVIQMTRIPLRTRAIVKLSELALENGGYDTPQIYVDTTLPKALQTPVVLMDMPAGPEVYEEMAKHAHLYTTSAANPDTPTRELVDQYGQLSNEQILSAYADKESTPEQFAFTLDVIENPVEDAIKRLKDKLGIKVVDHTVATSTEINLDADDVEEEEEVLA